MQNNIDKLLQKGLRRQYITAPTINDIRIEKIKYVPACMNSYGGCSAELVINIVIGVHSDTYYLTPIKQVSNTILKDIKDKFNETKEVSHLEYLKEVLIESGVFITSDERPHGYYTRKIKIFFENVKEGKFYSALRFGVLTDKGLEELKNIRIKWLTSVNSLHQSIENLKVAEQGLNVIRGANKGTEVDYLEITLVRLKSELGRIDKLITFNERRER